MPKSGQIELVILVAPSMSNVGESPIPSSVSYDPVLVFLPEFVLLPLDIGKPLVENAE